jgi:uncharacterized protein YdaU (DUF1376 family)
MHYYQFHIGDYMSHTIHLSSLEDLAYRRLLDMYYDTEQPIPNNIPLVSRRLRLGSDVVQSVLDEFFTLSDEGYKNHRADLEIREYHAFIDKQRNNGKLGGRPKKTQRKPTANPSQTQKKPNQQPLTTNQQPIKSATEVAAPDGVSSIVWDSFVKQRKSKKAQITQLVLDGIRKEADKAGLTMDDALQEIVMRNWVSFKAEWVAPKQSFANKFDVAHVTTPPPPNQDAALRKIEEDLKNAKPPSLEVLAKMAQLRKSMA